MKFNETTTVHRLRADMHLEKIVGFAWALGCICDTYDKCSTHNLRVIVEALTANVEKLCEEHGLDSEGRRA